MSALEFFMPMVPPTVTDQQKGVTVKGGKPRFYTKDEVGAAHEKLRAHLAQHVPAEPFDGPLRMYSKWCFPMVKGTYDGQPKDTAPDTGNLNKALHDVMEQLGFFVNDSRIAENFEGKYWAKLPGIWIRLEEMR